jgi:hypothetical protein
MLDILRVVIDTNHIISAILSARGASAKLIDWMTREEDYFRLLISPHKLDRSPNFSLAGLQSFSFGKNPNLSLAAVQTFGMIRGPVINLFLLGLFGLS